MICISLCLLLVESLSSLRTALCIRKGRNKINKKNFNHYICYAVSTCQGCPVSALGAPTAALPFHPADKLCKPTHSSLGSGHVTQHLAPQGFSSAEISLSSAACDIAHRANNLPISTSLFAFNLLPAKAGEAPISTEPLQPGWLFPSPGEMGTASPAPAAEVTTLLPPQHMQSLACRTTIRSGVQGCWLS